MASRRERQARAIGPIGTAARLGLGVLLLAIPFAFGGADAASIAAGAAGIPAVVLAAQYLWTRRPGASLDATGPAGMAFITAVGLVLFSLGPTRDAALIFAGGSMILAGIRGYAGCEILAVSNFLLRRDDQVGCIVFSPLDAAESSLRREQSHQSPVAAAESHASRWRGSDGHS